MTEPSGGMSADSNALSRSGAIGSAVGQCVIAASLGYCVTLLYQWTVNDLTPLDWRRAVPFGTVAGPFGFDARTALIAGGFGAVCALGGLPFGWFAARTRLGRGLVLLASLAVSIALIVQTGQLAVPTMSLLGGSAAVLAMTAVGAWSGIGTLGRHARIPAPVIYAVMGGCAGAGALLALTALAWDRNFGLISMACGVFFSGLIYSQLSIGSAATGPASPVVAIRGWLKTVREGYVWTTQLSLIGLSFVGPLIYSGVIRGELLEGEEPPLFRTWYLLKVLMGAAAVGGLSAILQRSPYRISSYVPWGWLLLAVGVSCYYFGGICGISTSIVGFGFGTAAVGTFATFAWSVQHRDPRTAWTMAAVTAILSVLGGTALLSVMGGDAAVAAATCRSTLFFAVVGLFVVIGALTARDAIEGFMDSACWFLYRIKGRGPGAALMPEHGPALVIANHAAWADPLFLAKVTFAPTVPMMTSGFYDLPGMRFLMRHIFHTIRVADKAYRREAPELQEAIDALDRGSTVVIFPEGYLRRKEELPLRRFGRGVWQILHARPNTPVYACWIEGGWGSFFSHRGGPPTKKKKPDIWRPINVGICEPFVVPAEIRDDHLAVRRLLMERVSQARTYVGLAPLDLGHAIEGHQEAEESAE